MMLMKVQPTYFASLVGAMMASTDLEKGRPLSSGMFSSRSHYQFLAKIFRPWKLEKGQHLSQEAKKITLNAAGLLFPWMNVLAGKLNLTEMRFSEVERTLDQLIKELERKKSDARYSNWEWDGFILDFRLRLGEHPIDLVFQLLDPFLAAMEEYHDTYYLNYWSDQERQSHERWLEREWVNSEYQSSLMEGVRLLYESCDRPQRSLPVRVALNKFLGSLDASIPQATGFGLRGTATVHVAPSLLLKPEALLHEIAHIFFHDQHPFADREVTKQLWEKIRSRMAGKSSPVPFWTMKELFLHEVEEIVADFVAAVLTKKVFPDHAPYSPYADQDEILALILSRLEKHENELLNEGINEVLTIVLKEWKE